MTTSAGFIALIGEPNAGKSTLTNAMVGAKVSIVTHKVQTTRARIRGVALEGEAQLVFVDTPGLFKPRRRLDRAMVAAAWGGAADADVVVLMVEAHRGITQGVEHILEGLSEIGKGRTVALAINKIDRVEASTLLALSEKLNATNFRLTLDVGHLHCQRETPIADHVQQWAEQIVNVHIEDMRSGMHEHLMFDEGEMDFLEIIRILRDFQFSGALCPDHLPAHRDDPSKLQAFAFAYGYIKALIHAANSEVQT